MADAFVRDHMTWLRRVALDRAVSAGAVRLAVILTGYINRRTGDAFPSQKTLAADLNVTDRQVRRLTDELEAAGHLVAIRAGKRQSNRYRPTTVTGHQASAHEDAVTGHSAPGDRTFHDKTPVAECPPNPSKGKPPEEPEGRRARETPLPALFPSAAEIAAAQAKFDEQGQHVDAALEAEKFRAHAETHDRRARSWKGAWATWCLKAPQFASRTPNSREVGRPTGIGWAVEGAYEE